MRYPADPILLIDDEACLLASFERILHEQGITHTLTCADSRKVMNLLETHTFETIIMDLDMPHISGKELLPSIRQQQPHAVILIATGAADIGTAVACMQQGASDYLLKPVDANRLIASVRNAIDIYELRTENLRLKHHFLSNDIEHPAAFQDIVTRNTAMRSVLKYVEAVSESPQPVLITGETGSGKELVARAVHTLSGRAGSFVAVNVAGLDDVMFSDTLFGHVKGAFTGADTKRGGMIEAAAGGTLFLDEIGDLAPASQVKLLRLLQGGDYLPLGSDHPLQSEARIVAATNKDVAELKAGTCMRSDLYYRLAVHSVRIPPLRERLDDVPLLLQHFVGLATEDLGRPPPAIDANLVARLQRLTYPGNVREFAALVRDAISTLQGDTLRDTDFRDLVATPEPAISRHAGNPPGTRASLAETGAIVFPDPIPTSEETLNALIRETMRRCGNNQTLASKSIGVSRQTLNKKWGELRHSDQDAPLSG